jgi:hypothetical protein
MATPEERIRLGDVTLVFDAANVSTKRLFKLAKDAVGRGTRLRAVVPVTAHIEKVLDLRQTRQSAYDAARVRAALEDAQVEVLPLDVEAAEAAAARLHTWFPTDDEWQAAKRARLRFGANEPAPATIDWITSAMCPEDAIVVTDDKGAEWRGCDTIGSKELANAFANLTTARPAP